MKETGREPDPVDALSIAQMVGVMQSGWRTEAEHKVLLKVQDRLRNLADDAYKQCGARCRTCGRGQ